MKVAFIGILPEEKLLADTLFGKYELSTNTVTFLVLSNIIVAAS